MALKWSEHGCSSRPGLDSILDLHVIHLSVSVQQLKFIIIWPIITFDTAEMWDLPGLQGLSADFVFLVSSFNKHLSVISYTSASSSAREGFGCCMIRDSSGDQIALPETRAYTTLNRSYLAQQRGRSRRVTSSQHLFSSPSRAKIFPIRTPCPFHENQQAPSGRPTYSKYIFLTRKH